MVDTVNMMIQVNGRDCCYIKVALDEDEESITKRALENPKVKDVMARREIAGIVVVPGSLVSIKVKD